MAAMYGLPAYMSSHVDPNPVGVVYALPSYHRTANGDHEANGQCNGNVHLVDPAKLVEKKQIELIASLTLLGEKLNALLKQKGSSKAEVKAAPTAALQQVVVSAEGTKKDKDAKKEARKAAKQEAKSKISGEAPEHPAKGKAVNFNSAGTQWHLKEDKQSTETGQSLTACIKSKLALFTPQKISDLKLTVTDSDMHWIKALSNVGEKRGVRFTGAVSNKCENGNSSVSVEQGDRFFLSYNDGLVKSRVVAWQLLGSALGLYSYDASHAIQATHQREWLVKIDRVMQQKLELDAVLREMSQFLARFDTLGSQFNIGVADIVIRSFITAPTQPNNIELWANRVDSL